MTAEKGAKAVRTSADTAKRAVVGGIVAVIVPLLIGLAAENARAREGFASATLVVELVKGDEDEIINPVTAKFTAVLRRALDPWWKNEGRAITANAWRIGVSQAYRNGGALAGLLVSCCEMRRAGKVCSWIAMDHMRDPAAAARIAAAAITGTITRKSGKEVTEQ